MKQFELTLLLFNFFKVYHFEITLLFYKIVLYIRRKNFLSATIITWKKYNSKLAKNAPVCMCKERRIRAGKGFLREGRGDYLKYLKWGWNRKEGGETNISKRWGQAGSRGGYLKKASCEKHSWMMPNVFTTILSIKETLDTLPWIYPLTLDMSPKNLKRKEGQPFNHYTELVSPKIFRSPISDINGFSNNKTDSIAYLAIPAFQNQKAKIVI